PNGREVHPLLGRHLIAAVREQVFETQLSVHRPATLADHKVQGKVIMPGAAYLEMAVAAGTALHGKPWCVRDMSMVEPLLLDKTPKTVQTIVTPEGPHAASVRMVSLAAGDGESEPEFATHAVGHIAAPLDAKMEIVDLEAIRRRFTGEARDAEWRKEALRKSGLEPGPTFSWFVLHWTNPQEALGQLRPACETDRAGQYQVHPGLLDSTLQLLGSILPGAGTGIDAYVPMAFERLQCFAIPQRRIADVPAADPLWVLASLTSFDGDLAVGNVDLIDAQGQVLVKMEGASLRRVSRDWVARLAAGPLPDWCYELAWVSQPLSTAEIDETAIEPGHWLIFDSRNGVGRALAERLRMKAHQCTLVPAGISAESRCTAVEAFLAGQVPARRGIVYLAGLDVEDDQGTPDFDAARRDGWGAVLDLVNALGASGKAKPPRFWLVTRGAQAAGNATPLALAQSPIWGLGRVVAAEHPELGCTRIDLDPADRRDAADQLTEEIWSGQNEDQVAYRGGERLVARLRRLEHVEAHSLQVPRGRSYRPEITFRGQLDNVALQPSHRQSQGPDQFAIRAAAENGSAKQALVFREDATYLITGGLGGLGLKLVQWLVDRGAHHLVLLGRSGVSDQARTQLDAVIRPGVQIAVRKCDIGNQAEVAAVLAQIAQDMPALRGIFHLAGVLDDGILREQNRERFDRVMAAKVHGAWNLHELTRDLQAGAPPLDLFVLFSSAAAILGSPGQGNYAAANAFLDALAHHRRALNLPALSINWGSWDEVGMAARLKDTEGQRWSAAGIGWIGVDQGMATLERLILEERIQAAVLPIDWPKFFERIPADSDPAWLLEMARTARTAVPAAESGPPELLDKLQAVTPAERLEVTVTDLRQQAARVLAMDEAHLPDPRRTLNELGFDSLTAVEFCNRVSRSIGQRLNPAVLFDYPTLESLAGYVLREVLAMEPVSKSTVDESADSAAEEAAKVLDDVETMSEAEMDALVTVQLGRLDQ
ncbi:MAG: type I polyketide synthase, partial [Thermoguttaceae bacterium]